MKTFQTSRKIGRISQWTPCPHHLDSTRSRSLCLFYHISYHVSTRPSKLEGTFQGNLWISVYLSPKIWACMSLIGVWCLVLVLSCKKKCTHHEMHRVVSASLEGVQLRLMCNLNLYQDTEHHIPEFPSCSHPRSRKNHSNSTLLLYIFLSGFFHWAVTLGRASPVGCISSSFLFFFSAISPGG